VDIGLLDLVIWFTLGALAALAIVTVLMWLRP
jgi:hypothetical protein